MNWIFKIHKIRILDLCLRPRREGGILKWALVWCLSVCPVLQHNSRTERPRKPIFGRMEAYHTGNPWTYLEVKRSKVKVTRATNSHTVNAQYLPNRKAYEVQTWYTDEARILASATSAKTFKVKVARSRDASDRCWPISRERNVL